MATDLAAMTLFAALTALGARLSFHLPYTPVPVTGQVFCVLLAGAVLGPRLGFASQVEYLAAGAAGLPVFSAGGGAAAMLGPTAGYLLCFPLAALVVGTVVGRLGQSTWSYATAGLAGVVSVYLLGASWFAVWSAFLGRPIALAVVLTQSVVPFIAPDVVKAGLVASVAPRVRRRLGVW
ncbi:MAG: biotin transporter BioY [Armatimonadota bacterium]|jgi:biotin transport system substrate-specific component